MEKSGDHLLQRLGSSLSNVIRQADKNFNFDDFRIQYLAFGNYLVVFKSIFGFGSAKTIL